MSIDAEVFAAAMAGGPEAFVPIVERYQDAVFGVVENVLKSEAPREDFGQRVFELVDLFTERHNRWHETLAEIRRIGADGMGGFVRALALPHWQSRRFAVVMLTRSELTGETVVTLLKQASDDANKKVRAHALALLDLDVDNQRKRAEFLPLLIPLLTDRSTLVRAATFCFFMADEVRNGCPIAGLDPPCIGMGAVK